MKNVPEKYKQGQQWFDAHYISVIEVEDRYGVSRQQQRNLYVKGSAPDALYIGHTLFYWRATAEPWFADYDKRQKERVASSQERKSKTKGPRKAKGSTYTLFGTEYPMPDNIGREYDNWLNYVVSFYPDYFLAGQYKNVVGDMVLHQPQELKNALREVHDLFRKMKAGKL